MTADVDRLIVPARSVDDAAAWLGLTVK